MPSYSSVRSALLVLAACLGSTVAFAQAPLVVEVEGIPCGTCRVGLQRGDGTVQEFTCDSLGWLQEVVRPLFDSAIWVDVLRPDGVIYRWERSGMENARPQVDTLRFSADMRLPVAIEDVTVSALRSGIRDNGRTLSYSVKDDALAKALPTAAEVLRRVPLVSVTGEGVPMLRGSTRIKVLVNGKEMPGLTAAQVLAMINPEEIERVDVQTLPSVHHASSGVDGVIDLIVRRKVKSNTSGQLNAGVGSAGSHLMGVLNQPLGKAWSLTLNTGNLIGYSRIGTRIELIRNEQDTISLTEKGWSIGGYLSGGFTVARSTPNHQLDFGAWGYYNTIRNSTKGTLSSSTTVQEAKMREENTSYLVGGSYSYSGRRNLKINLTSYGTFIPLYREYSRDAISAKSEQGILGYMCDVDTEWRILRQLTLECGGNYRYSRFLASQRISTQAVALEHRATAFTSLDYSPWTKLGLTVGGHYAYNAVMPLADEWHRSHSFLLDAAVALRFSYRNTLTLQYSRSNEAPSYGQLAPQSSYPSIFLCVAGNPDLQHGLLQRGELTWSYFTTWHYVRISAYYKHVEDPVAQVTTLTANALQAQYTNIDASTLVGGDAWLTLKFFHGDLTLQLGGGMQQTTLSFGERKGKGLEWYCSFNGTYSFSKHWLLTLFGTYQSPRVRLEGRESLYWYSNLSLYRSFLEDKLRLAISGDNLFTYPMRVAQTIVGNDFSYSQQTDYYNMGARLLLVWRFGIKSVQHEQGAAKDVYNRGL